MSVQKRKSFLACLLVLFIAFFAMGFISISEKKTVKADEPAVTLIGGEEVDLSSFSMYYGAAVRMTSPTGLRFTTGISEEVFNQLNGISGVTISFGTLIVPEDYLKDVSFTHVSLKEANLTMLDIPAKNFITNDSLKFKEGNVEFTGVITDIRAANIARTFRSRAYLKVVADGDSAATYYYASYYTDSDNTIIEADYDNSRSVAEVAYRAKKSGDNYSNAQIAVLTDFSSEYCYEIYNLQGLKENSDAANFSLETDLIVDFDGSVETASVIKDLRGEFNGNGNTLTLNIVHTAANANCFQNFIETIGHTGVVKNLNVVINFTASQNIAYFSAFTHTLNGEMKDCSIKVNHANYWVNNVGGYLTYDGSGSISNVVLEAKVVSGPAQHDGSIGLVTASGAINVSNSIFVSSNTTLAGEKVDSNIRKSNICVVFDANEYAESGFDTTSFDTNVWNVEEGILPTIKAPERPYVEVSTAAELVEQAAKGNVNIKLTSDITINADMSNNTADYKIALLSTVLDGNGHTITVKASGGQTYAAMAFIGEITTAGVLQNVNIVYEINQTSDVTLLAEGVVGTLNGTICNVNLTITHATYYVDNEFIYIARSGNGRLENSVVSITGSGWQFGQGVYHVVTGSVTCENVLLIYTGSNGISGTNCVKIAGADAYETSGFNVASFDTDVWNVAEGEVPTLKDPVISYVEVSTAAELVEQAAKGNVNIKLTSDITINADMTNNTADYKIAKLSAVLNGNGHTITVKASGGQTYSTIAFIGEITETGVLQNVNIVYEINQTNNVTLLSEGVVGTLNGTIRNVSIAISHATYYVDSEFVYIARSGNGRLENSVVSITGSGWQFGQSVYHVVTGTVTCENVLLIYTGSNGISGTNCVKIAGASDYASSGFNASSFDANVWKVVDGAVPTIKAPERPYVEVSTAAELVEQAAKGNVNIKLTSDITINADMTNNTADYKIALLSTVLDGNGYTITVYAAGAQTYSTMAFIGEIAETGVLQNVNIVYEINQTGDVTLLAEGVVGTLNGTIRNVNLTITHATSYVDNECTYIARSGNGRLENSVVSITGSGWQFGQSVYHVVTGTVTCENVLLIYTGSNSISGTNCVKIAGASDYASSGFNASSFDANVWKVVDGAVPTIKAPERPYVEVSTAAELVEQAAKGNVNIKLTSDITINADMTSNTADYKIALLSTVLDGDGYTITVKASGGQMYAAMAFIGKIAETGVLQNVNIVYEINQTGDVTLLAEGVVGTLNGTIRNVNLTITHATSYVDNECTYIARSGNGRLENSVVSITGSGWQFGQGVYHVVTGSVTCENVLLIYTGSNGISGTNCVKIAGASDYASSGFNASSFDTNVWTVVAGVVPTFKGLEIKVVEVSTATELVEQAAKGNVNIKLTSDITINADMTNNTADYKIALLSTVLDGDGYTITVKASGGQMYAAMAFIGEIAETGVLQNVNIVYEINQTNNVTVLLEGVVGTLNGTIRNVSIAISHATYYVDNEFIYIARSGNGRLENSVVSITGSGWQFGQSVYHVVTGTVTCENVLLIYTGSNGISGTNCVKIASASDCATSGFDVSSFAIYDSDSIWALDENGIPVFKNYVNVLEERFYLVIPDTWSGDEKAVLEIREIWNNSTDATLKIVHDDVIIQDSRYYIVLGIDNKVLTLLAGENGYNIKTLNEIGSNGMAIKTFGNVVCLYGHTLQGTLNAVYEYSERIFGYEFFAEFEIAQNEVENIVWYDFDECYKPLINNSHLLYEYLGTNLSGQYKTENLYSLWIDGLQAHTYPQLLPVDQYSNYYDANGNFCFAGAGNQTQMITDMVNAVIPHLQNDTQRTYLMLGQPDTNSFCSCSNCSSRLLQLRLSMSMSKEQAQAYMVIEFNNEVVKQLNAWIAQNQPGRIVKFVTFAYNATAHAPVVNGTAKIQTESNLIVQLVINNEFAMDYSKTYAENSLVVEALQGWKLVTANSELFVWDYGTNFYYYMEPFYNWDTIAANYQYLSELGVTMYVNQATYNTVASNFEEMRMYVQSNLLWGETTNTDELVQRFMAKYYGEVASDYVYALYQKANEHIQSILNAHDSVFVTSGSLNAQSNAVMNQDYWSLANFEELNSYIDAAINAVRNSELTESEKTKFIERIEKERVWISYWKVRYYGTMDSAEYTNLVKAMKQYNMIPYENYKNADYADDGLYNWSYALWNNVEDSEW